MKSTNITPDDPRLTAYALGELPAEECAVVEAMLATDGPARAAVAEVRALAGQLKSALASESTAAFSGEPILGGDRLAVGESAATTRSVPDGAAPLNDPYRRKVVRFPYFLVGSLAAACFAVLVAVKQEPAKVSRPSEVGAVVQRPHGESPDGAAVVGASGKRAGVVPGVGADSRAWEDRGVLLSKDAEEFAKVPAGRAGEAVEPVTEHLTAEELAPSRRVAAVHTQMLETGREFFRVQNAPSSTFSVDVDTASYANVRKLLQSGRRPPRDAVRIEELINYFPSGDAQVKDPEAPIGATTEIAAAPWNPAHRLVRIGVKGRDVSDAERPSANLVFLLDVSGSMAAADRLPLVKDSLALLLGRLRDQDRVAIVTNAATPGVALPSTPISSKREILEAVAALKAGGARSEADGLLLAYEIAKANFVERGANRVIFCTDDDFKFRATGEAELVRMVEERARAGVSLNVLGFGKGVVGNAALGMLAGKGQGRYGRIDSRAQAQTLLVEQAGGTFVALAKNVELMIEFNPVLAQSYRLIGYESGDATKTPRGETRAESGEIEAGQTVTALYEVVPVGAPMPEAALVAGSRGAVEDPNEATAAAAGAVSRELFTLKIRYNAPSVSMSQKLEIPVIDAGTTFESASKDFKFTAAVASLGMLLRESPHKGEADYDKVLAWAKDGQGADADGRRGEFIELVKIAKSLTAE